MASVKQYDNIDLKKINILKPEKINNSYFGFMNYDDNKEPIYIQTPKLKSNINVVDILDSKNPHLDVTISLNDIKFYDLLVNIDDTILTKTLENSENWFSKILPLNVIDEMYKPLHSSFKKGDKPKIKFKIPISKNKIQCTCYNQKKECVDITNIKKDDNLILVLHLRGIKILKQTFYCDCYISQIKILENKVNKYQILEDYSILGSEEDDEDLDIFDEEIINEMKRKEEEKQNKIKELKKEINNFENEIKNKKNILTELLNK